MPKSDSWPDGTEPETMNRMDSAGSCDSIVSGNSGFSEDSLEHLSAEEKACLMFLEETIDALDNEDDSGVSHDEPEELPRSGNLAAKLADLSLSMGKSNINTSQRTANQPVGKNVDTKHMQSYLVPTPFVVASGSHCPLPSTKALTPVETAASSKSQFISKNIKAAPGHNQKRAAPPVPLEGNVATPPSIKPRENLAKPAEGPLPRGPLSYEALAHLRRNASQKKTPLCPTVDHTIELDRQCPPPVEGPQFGNVTKSEKTLTEVHKSKTGPPAVPPKPKVPGNIHTKVQNEEPITPDLSEGVKHTTNPEMVRLEALQKLGLLKENSHEGGAEPPPPKRHSKNPARGPSDPAKKTSFYFTKEQTKPKKQLLQNNGNIQQQSKEEQQPVLLLHMQSQSSGMKTKSLQHSVNQDSSTHSRNHSEPQHRPGAKPVKTSARSQPSSDTPAESVGYTSMVVPGMGSDRKEALRKLGLIKR